jgi:hypothetical protein
MAGILGWRVCITSGVPTANAYRAGRQGCNCIAGGSVVSMRRADRKRSAGARNHDCCNGKMHAGAGAASALWLEKWHSPRLTVKRRLSRFFALAACHPGTGSHWRPHSVIMAPHRCIQWAYSGEMRMFPVPSLVVLLGLTLCIVASHQARAQQTGATGVVYEAARNKIGLILYCRNNGLLARGIADQAVATMEAGLLKMPAIDPIAKELGERAQKAGEDGYWEAGRKRDIANVAQQFRTTPTSLCQDWAGETLRRNAETVPVIVPTTPVQPVKPTAVEPVQDYKPPVRATAASAVVKPAFVKPPIAKPAPRPEPEKAPLLPTKAEPTLQPRLSPDTGQPAPVAKAPPAYPNAVTARATSAPAPDIAPQPKRVAPASPKRQSAELLDPPPLREPPATAALPRPREFYDEEPRSPIWGKWPLDQVGRRGRCLMPGCKW